MADLAWVFSAFFVFIGTTSFLRIVGGANDAQRKHLEMRRWVEAEAARRNQEPIVATPV
jgi:hypothetical protein